MDRGPMRRRLDLVLIPFTDPDTGRVFELPYPDPRRYDWRTIDGVRYLHDRLDGSLIEEGAFWEGMNKFPSLPVYDQKQLIGSSQEYVESRRGPIRAQLLDAVDSPNYRSPSEDFLRSIPTETHDFVILSLDLVGSTNRAIGTPLGEYARTMQVVFSEIGEVLPKFHGHVLKHTGDGVIAYFAAPGFITMHDLAIDCALTLRRLVYEGFNPVLRELGRKELATRMGLDSGTIAVVSVGSVSSKQERDLIGEVVSLACKIQGLAPVGGITLGDEVLCNLHLTWRGICEEVQLPPTWTYRSPESDRPYRVHLVQARDWNQPG
ncbi:MAG: adenylate/guanylate cyclase domain-containing protein [Planctomycetota bacterium]